MRRVVVRAACLVSAVVVLAPAAADAQSPTAQGAAPAVELTVFGGAGGVFPGSQPGFDRSTGAAYVVGVELARPAAAGLLAHLALRAEGGFASQSFDLGGGVAYGDVQTPHTALALRVALLARPSSRRLMPYAVAGGAFARPSTRLVLAEGPRATPGARFEQVTHEGVPGALLGGGLAWQGRRLTARAEARWLTLATEGGPTSTIPVVLTLGLPLLHR